MAEFWGNQTSAQPPEYIAFLGRALALLSLSLILTVSGVDAASPEPALEYNRLTGKFAIRVQAASDPQSRPSGLEQILRSVFDRTTNAIRISASPNPPGQILSPTSSDQIFTSIFNSGLNAIQVNCVAGCNAGAGGSGSVSTDDAP